MSSSLSDSPICSLCSKVAATFCKDCANFQCLSCFSRQRPSICQSHYFRTIREDGQMTSPFNIETLKGQSERLRSLLSKLDLTHDTVNPVKPSGHSRDQPTQKTMTAPDLSTKNTMDLTVQNTSVAATQDLVSNQSSLPQSGVRHRAKISQKSHTVVSSDISELTEPGLPDSSSASTNPSDSLTDSWTDPSHTLTNPSPSWTDPSRSFIDPSPCSSNPNPTWTNQSFSSTDPSPSPTCTSNLSVSTVNRSSNPLDVNISWNKTAWLLSKDSCNVRYIKTSFDDVLAKVSRRRRNKKSVQLSEEFQCKLGVVNGNIWLTRPHSLQRGSIVQVFNQDLDHVTDLSWKEIWFVEMAQQVSHTDVIVVSRTGAFVVSTAGTYRYKIMDSLFCDITVRDQEVAVIESVQNTITLLHETHGQWKPQCIIPFGLDIKSEEPKWLLFGPDDKTILVALHDRHKILQLDKHNGQILAEYGGETYSERLGEFNLPYLSMVDGLGNVVVCDELNVRFQVLSSNGVWKVCECVDKLGFVKDIVVFRSNVYILHNRFSDASQSYLTKCI